jgi:hypothetical protein
MAKKTKGKTFDTSFNFGASAKSKKGKGKGGKKGGKKGTNAWRAYTSAPIPD